MSLYDDEDVASVPESSVAAVTGWSKSVNWLQSQQKQTLVAKKAAAAAAAAASIPTSLSNRARSSWTPGSGGPALPPVINLQQKTNKKAVDATPPPKFSYGGGDKVRGDQSLLPLKDPNWIVVNEYDPLWPNDYHKVVQDMRDSQRTPEDDSGLDLKKRCYTDAGRERARERFQRDDDALQQQFSGFSRRPDDGYSNPEGNGDKDEEARQSQRQKMEGSDRSRHFGSPFPTSSSSSSTLAVGGGAAIAPPPSLTESSHKTPTDRGDSPLTSMSMLQKMASTPASTAGLGIAAKIMAKYGYKHGQGLGRSEQGMSQALAVEKTSKRGGRIVHEKEMLMPPPPLFGETLATPPHVAVDQQEEDSAIPNEKPSITDLMKNPGKVVVCKNMVGAGEVDADLEPEIKEECQMKYGEVIKVVIFELSNVAAEEAVRIFIEFKRVESAIKAVVDLNGRFFGGREVTASFYDAFQFQNLQLTD